ncbi:MAG: hypothetical protein IJV27_05000 [Prevotella sp.]|nr:hypothetical protein [Prevotella sp.]
MKTFRILFLTAALIFSFAVVADNYTDLVVVGQSQESIPLADFTSIAFQDGKMNILNDQTMVRTYVIKDLKKMFFKGETNDIRSLLSSQMTEESTIYNLQGIRVAEGSSFFMLPKGVYILKTGNNVRKILKK